MYALIENNQVVQYPYSYEDLKATQPNTSWPVTMSPEELAEYGVVIVVVTGQPDADYTQNIAEETPAFVAERNRWEQQWVVSAATEDEIAQRLAEQTAQKDAMRANAYQTESDPLFFKSQRGEATHQEWLDKVAEIQARYP